MALIQIPIALAAVAISVWYPQPDSEAVLIVPGELSPASAVNWAREHNLTLVGLSTDGQYPIVQFSPETSAFDALSSGFIPVKTQVALCTPSEQSQRLTL